MPVYQAFYRLALDVEIATRGVGYDFKWLRSQVLRSSESVCANMAEGFYAQYTTEYIQCLFRCRREGRESLVHLNYSADAGLIARQQLEQFTKDYEAALHQLAAVIRSLESKMQTYGKSKHAPLIAREDGPEWNDDASMNHHPSPIS